MQADYDLTGRLQPLWARVGGRDELARLTGISGPTLSAYNTGRQRARARNIERIAAAVGVTVGDLVTPADEVTLLLRLVKQLESQPERASGDLAPEIRQLADALQALATRLRQATARSSER